MTVKVSVYIATSLDGFIARTNGGLDWLSSGDGASNGDDYGYQAFMDSVDAVVMGRNTFEKVLTFDVWPYSNKHVVVLSSGVPEIPLHLSTSVERLSLAPPDVVKHLAARGATHVYLDGGKTIQRFLNARLVNELIITRVPILIGDGIPLFGPGDSDIKLKHIETRSFENGFVQSRYSIPDIA